MSAPFLIQSSDPLLLQEACRVADQFAQKYIQEDIVGIVFLGAVARGYFDASADIDIALFEKHGAALSLAGQFLKMDDFEIHVHLADYEKELHEPWDMAKRWTYSQGKIFSDPQGLISRLLEEKVPLKPDEKKWLLMSGTSLSEWYINRLTLLWLDRGDLVSAHAMFAQGLNYFFDILFALNDELVPDSKWRYFCAATLNRVPLDFQERLKETMILRAFTVEEINRRRVAFMEMWRDMLPIVEREVQMPFEEISQLV
jgi:hypothetical protein